MLPIQMQSVSKLCYASQKRSLLKCTRNGTIHLQQKVYTEAALASSHALEEVVASDGALFFHAAKSSLRILSQQLLALVVMSIQNFRLHNDALTCRMNSTVHRFHHAGKRMMRFRAARKKSCPIFSLKGSCGEKKSSSHINGTPFPLSQH